MSDLVATLARKRVPLGFVCGVVVIVLAAPTFRTLAIGGAIAALGELMRIWAAGHLEKGKEVTRSGPYRLTRHPLYLGSAVIGVGAALASARVVPAVAIALYLAVTTTAAIRTEEAAMRAAFGDQYDAYLGSRAQPVERSFNLGRAIRNKEYRAIAGLAAVAAMFAWKAVYR